MSARRSYSCWLTAQEIADACLPGLPATKRKVNERAAVDGWLTRVDNEGCPLARKRKASGGGMEFHVSLLPQSAYIALQSADRHEPEIMPLLSDSSGKWAAFERQSTNIKEKAARALKIIQAVETLLEAGVGKTLAVAEVATKWSVGSSTIYGWIAAIEGVPVSDRLPYLAPNYQGGGKEAEIDADVWQFLRSDYLRLSQPSWESCIRRAGEIAKKKGMKLPSARTLWRKFEREVPEVVVTLNRKGVDALRKHLPPQTRSVADLHAMELVNIDGHTCDVMVRFPDGRIGRPVMVAIQDVMSRKFLVWRHAATEDTITARLCFADLFKKYGIPKGLLSDNGRAFASKWLTGGAPTRFRFRVRPEEPVGLLTAVGITIHWALPFRGSSKPIERGFRDFCDAIAKHPAFEGAYTGNNALNKPDNYGEKAVDWETFIAVWNAGVAEHNARPGRRTEMARGKDSFDQVFERSYAVSPIGKATDDQLRMALYAAELVSADRDTGAVKVLGNKYWTSELVSVAGTKVTVRFDPDDATCPVHVYDAKGAFVATAEIWGRTGFLDAAAAKRRAKLEADHRKAAKAASRALDLLSADQLAAMLPDYEDEAPLPSPTVIRPVRHRGQTAAALKPVSNAAEQTAQSQFIDHFGAAVERRFPRLVE